MTLSKKHFEALAAALYRSPDDMAYYARYNSHEQLHAHLCYSVCDALAEMSPAFDKARFIKACGVAS